MAQSRVTDTISRDLYALEDESNPRGSRRTGVWPSTTLDQVFDQERSDHKTLRQILADLRQEIITGGRGNIEFPVTSVNGQTGDVTITPATIGLDQVDNTRDINKPLSDPQREALMDILKNYDFNVNLQELYDHLLDSSNPHGVSLEQINKDDALTKFVQVLISKHNFSTLSNVHMDIRRSLSHLWNIVDTIGDGLDEKLENLTHDIEDHMTDVYAHQNLFDAKEDLVNKAVAFSDSQDNNHSKYPSTRAVVEYVIAKIAEFSDTLPKISSWIDDIIIVKSRADIPEATSRYYRKVYIIQEGARSKSEMAVCRLDTEGNRYFWDYSEFGTYWKFNPYHFKDSAEGLTINTTNLMESMLNEKGALEKTLAEILSRYYTREEVDDKAYLQRIRIVPGTQDGTIRYYINGDEQTMSDDIRVSGLRRLAFLDYVTEEEIYDQAVQERHIINRGVVTRHLRERAVTHEKIMCPPGYIIGNIDDDTMTAHLLPIENLGGLGEEFEEMSEWTLQRIWNGEELPGYDDEVSPDLVVQIWNETEP